MTDPSPRLPPAGWYPDPEYPTTHLRWWDGFQWSLRKPIPEGPPPGQPPAPVTSGFRRLARVVVVLLRLSVLLGAAIVLLDVWGLTTVVPDLEQGNVTSAGTYDALAWILSGILSMVLLLGTAICWLVWQNKLVKTLPAGSVRRGSGWHVGSWFIPIVSLWFPYQNMADLWDRIRPAGRRAVLGWWWAGWLLGNTGGLWVSGLSEELDDPGDVRAMMWMELVGTTITIGAALLAVRIVAGLTAARVAGLPDGPDGARRPDPISASSPAAD